MQSSSDIEEVMRKSLALAIQILRSQSASIFLLSKNGVLERKAIHGVDANSREIPPDWFPTESYGIGESFSGKAAASASKSSFGQPYWSEDLSVAELDETSKKEYLEKLGSLRCAAAVPLKITKPQNP